MSYAHGRRCNHITISGKVAVFTLFILLLSVLPCASVWGIDVSSGLSFLKGNQVSDGGFAEPGESPLPGTTCRAVLGIRASGQDPAGWAGAGGNPYDYLNKQAGAVSDLIDIELYVLAFTSAGADPRNVAGVNMVSRIVSKKGDNGRIGEDLYEHCMGVISLVSAGEEIDPECSEWIFNNQRSDGGWGDSNSTRDTAVAIEALAAIGEGDSKEVKNGIDYLKENMNADGGYSASGEISDCQTTSEVIMALNAAGENPQSESWTDQGVNPVDFLNDSQEEDGHFKYSDGVEIEPVKTTAMVLPAINGNALPLKASGSEGLQKVNDYGTLGAGLKKGSGDEKSWAQSFEEGGESAAENGSPGRSEAGYTGNKVNQLNNLWFLMIIAISYIIALVLSGVIVRSIMTPR